jgi:hypothetical protein
MAKKSYAKRAGKRSAKRSMKRTTRRRSTKRSAKHSMRGGADSVSAPTTTGNFSLPQGLAYPGNSPMGQAMQAMKGGMSKDAYGVYGSPFFGMPRPASAAQQGGSAPYPGSVGERMLSAGMEDAAGTGRIDGALQQVAGLRDPNQVGGRKGKKSRKAKKSKKSRKATRKSKKSRKASRKAERKGRKASRKAHRRGRKSGRKAQRGGVMDYAESMSGGILPSSLLGKAGLHPSWTDAAAGRMV